MAKRNYESKIALATRNFVNVKEQTFETPEEQNDEIENPIKKEEKKELSKTPTQKKEKSAPEKKEPVPEVAEKESPTRDEVEEKVNSIIQSLIESGQLTVKKPGKSGRPRKYDDETVQVSLRLTKSNYDFAHKMGKTKYDSMTEYINHIISKAREQ